MNKYVTIQSRSLVPDGEGGHTEVWTDIATAVPADIQPIREPMRSELAAEIRSRNVVAMHTISIRSYTPTDEIGRVVWEHRGDTRYYYIRTATNIAAKDIEIKLLAEERRA